MTDPKPCANACGRPQDRPGQRYCRICHVAYMVAWRKRRSEHYASLRARYEESVSRLKVEVDAFLEGR